MHALFLTFEFPPYFGGGLSTYMDQTVRMLSRYKVNTSVIVSDSSVPFGVWQEEDYYGAKVIRVNPYENEAFKYMGHWAAFSYAFSDTVKKYIARYGRPDWIESCDGFGISYFTLQRKLTLEKEFRDLTLLTTAHTPVSLIEEWNLEKKYVLPRYFYAEMEKFSLKGSDLVFSPSKFLIKELQDNFECAEVKFTHLPYAFENYLERFTGPEPVALANEAPFYMVASRMTYWKGIPNIIAGFDKYWKNGGKTRLKLFGSDTQSDIFGGSMTGHLSKKYNRHIADRNLQFCGLAAPGHLIHERKAARAQIHPSIKENFPFTVIENMANGGLTLASRSGGQAELIEHGHSGFLFDTFDPESISKVLFEADHLTEKELAVFSKNASDKIAKTCNYESVFAKKMELIEGISSIPKKHFPFNRGKQILFDAERIEKDPKLSIVIPHFNLGEFLEETVKSVLNSSYQNLEIVIVDDGSTDPTSLQVLDKVNIIDKRIKVIRQVNSGVAEARNNGVKNASGELIALLDADDLITANYYEKAIDILRTYDNVGFVGCWNEDFNEQGRIRLWTTINPEPPLQFLFNMTNCQGIVVRKNAFLQYGQHDKDLRMFLDDWESTVNMLANGVRGVMIPHGLFRYRIREGSVFRSSGGLWHHNYERIVAKHGEKFKDYAVEMILFLNENGPNTLYHNPTYESPLHAYTHRSNGTDNSSNGQITPFRNGRLARLMNRYYDYVELNPRGLRIRQKLNFIIEPFANWTLKRVVTSPKEPNQKKPK